MLKRTIQCLALGGSAVALGLVACGSPAAGNPTPTTGATVSLDLMGSSGTKIASCAGTLIAADTVITSAHCVHGVSFWQATLPSTGQVAHASIGYTFDWSDLSSTMSHPFHHDVAVVKLDSEINLSAYPSLAGGALADGAATMRVRPGADSTYEAVATRAYDGTAEGFPDYYYSTIDPSEALVTGSALIDPTTNTIYGIVSSRGASTGLLYSARVEMVSDWMSAFDSCSGPATIAKIFVDCHPTPPPPCDGGEGSSSGSSSGASSGGTSSGTSSGTTGGASSGGTSSGGTSSGTTGGASSGGTSSGTSSGTTGGASSGGTSSGSTGASSGGTSSGTTGGGGNGTTGNGEDGGTCGGGGGYCEGNGCGTTVGSGGNGTNGGGGGGSGGTSGGGASSGGTSSGTTGGGGNGTTGGSGNGGNGASSGGGYNGASSGASGSGNGTTGSGSGGDNGCTDSTCGGCADDPNCTDNVVDYGGSTTPPPVTTNPH